MRVDRRAPLLCACLLALVAGPGRAQAASPAIQEPSGVQPAAESAPAQEPPASRPRDSEPSWLERHGITVSSQYVAESFGWIRQAEADTKGQYLGSFSPSVSLDLGRLKAGRGEILVSVQTLRVRAPATSTIQPVSNLDASPLDKVAEAWYRDEYWKGRLTLKAGWHYADTEFGALEAAGSFLNGSYGANPTTPMPSYPDAALGVTSWVAASRAVSVGAGLFRGVSLEPVGGPATGRAPAFTIVEARVEPFRERASHHATLRVGVWRQAAAPAAPDRHGPRLQNDLGVYAAAEHRFGGQSPGAGQRNWGLFAQWGWAPTQMIEVCRYVGGGVSWRAPLAGRPHDEAGAGITRVTQEDGTRETTAELFYRFALPNRVFVQPDLQWIAGTGGRAVRGLAAGLRVGLEM